MKKILFILIGCGLLAGCGNSNKKNSAGDADTRTAVADGHNARNSLDYTGTYSGTLPCADCPGIKTDITLNPDNTFKMTTEYLERNNGEKSETTGEYSWNEEGSKITLHSGRRGEHDRKYMVQENRLLQLDLKGNVITGDLADNYILNKVE